MRKVLINGYPLAAPDTGFGVFTRSLIHALAGHASDRCNLRVALPSWPRFRSLDLPSSCKLLHVACTETGNQLVDEAAWQIALGVTARLKWPDSILFSPVPFWSPIAPRRCIVAHHDFANRHFPSYLGRSGLRRMLVGTRERFLRHATYVVSPSEFVRREIMQRTGIRPERVRCIPEWLPPEYEPGLAARNAPMVRARHSLPSRFWLYAGGYDIRKNIPAMLEAYSAAMRRTACPPMVLAGRIPAPIPGLVPDIAGIVSRLGIGSSIVMPGFIPPDDMPGLYAAADLLIYPSLDEGFGLPPLEAMGCGCPAAVSDVASLPEVVKDADYRFDPLRPDAITAILLKAASARLPLNPGFQRSCHDEAKGARMFADLIAAA